jgi:hypothetical protein
MLSFSSPPFACLFLGVFRQTGISARLDKANPGLGAQSITFGQSVNNLAREGIVLQEKHFF